jgi:NAD(P)-dependent dehydrogenase (short-subunit alcohol dehydrogenase family)
MLDAARGQAHRVLVADFRRPEAVRSVVTGFLAESGPVHILVNNTGGPPPGPASEAAPEAYLAAFTQHLTGPGGRSRDETMLSRGREDADQRVVDRCSADAAQNGLSRVMC